MNSITRCAHCRAQRLDDKPAHGHEWFLTHARDEDGLIFAKTRAERRRRWFVAYIAQYENVIAERRAA